MLKAGRAGSTPDGIAISQPLNDLLNDIGRSVFNLNSIAVGLDAVEHGHPKPDNLDISWDPTDRTIAARQARKFALEMALVHLSAAVRRYFDAMGKLSRFKPLYKKDEKAAEKVLKIARECVGNDYHAVVASLVVHWRNRIVHKSTAKLRSPEKTLLITNETEIASRYASLSITCLLCHFEEARPTLKDVSSLISMSINLVRTVDQNIGSSMSVEDLTTLLEHYGIKEKIEEIKGSSKPSKIEASIDRVFKASAPLLLEPYRRLLHQLVDEGTT